MVQSSVSNSVQERDFNQAVLSLGSHVDNDIVLSGADILPFHATILQEDEQYRIIPAESGAQIWVDGYALQDAFALFSSDQQIEIGDYALFFQSNGLPTGVHVMIYAGIDEEAPEEFLQDDTAEAILINMISGEADIEVEQSAFFEFEVVNAGPIVARFSVALRGVPKDWVEITPSVMNLNEGRRQLVQVRITPPREPDSEAGTHELHVVVTSPNYGRQRAVETLSLTIQPFYEFSLGSLSPRTQRIPWRKKKGITYLPVSNRSNTPADFNLMAMDDESGCSFEFLVEEDLQLNRQASVKLQPHETLEMPIQITPLKNPMFAMRSKQFHYTTNVQIPQQATAPQTVSGSVKRVPLFGWWSIMIGLVTMVLALFFILQPNIRTFDVAAGKDVIELGDTTKLEWNVSPFATRLSLSNVEQPINRGQVSETVAPGQSTTYELTSGNWLSGMFGMDQTEAVTVLVVPPTPQVNVFEVDRTEISKGQMVRVRWSVSEADEVLLTIDEVVYPLSEEEYSGEQEVLLEKDALVTLEAKNASGSELQSYFVNVVPPYININTFAIWVRPDEAVLNPGPSDMVGMQMGGKLFSPTYAPDPNFPTKFVEMVPEPESETGYRVEFNPDVREELQPGEQIVIEWDIDGADNLMVAPFEEPLPERGSQPFFPQESMNFVMTATSGELEGIYMLPVKVFDGEPPEAPTIDFFNASPQSMLGSGEVEFSWSVSDEWTRVNLSNADGVIADYLNPVGFQKIEIEESSTVILTAYNGDLSTAKPIEITVDPALIDPGLVVSSISPDTGRSMVGGQITVTVDFESIPDDAAYPTGTVTVTDGSAICSIPLPALTCNLVFTTSGLKSISASFPGDTIYLQSKSPDFDVQVDVASAQVDLLPSFYFIGGASPVSVESTEFELEKGMRTVVEVRPKNTVLADNKGTVTVSICDQDANDAIIDDTCAFIASGPVNVAATTANGQTAGYGYADVTIRNFNTTGKHGFLFEYSHLDNAIDPTSIFQPNITIKRAQLLFSYDSCDDSFALSNCTYGLVDGTTETPEIIFDLSLPASPAPVKLSSLLPSPPETDAFTVSSVPTLTWDCSVKTVSGSYKLVCNVDGLVSGTLYTVTYDYENENPIPATDPAVANHYYMGSDPDVSFGAASFDLQVLSSTKTKIGNLNGVKVGERIRLSGPSSTPGLIGIYDSNNTRVYPSAGLTLEETSGEDIFGVVNEGINCQSENDGSKVVISSANADCYVYFKHTGNYTFVATFEGDATYNGSISGDTLVAVQKQDGITGSIKYFGSGSYVSLPSNLTTKVSYQIQIALDGPDSNFSSGDISFPPEALVGRKVLITMQDVYSTTHCSLTEGELVEDLGNGIYEVMVTRNPVGNDPTTQNYVTAAVFELTCDLADSTGLSFEMTFSDKTTPIKDSDDFSVQTAVEVVDKAVSDPSLGNMTITFVRDDTAKTKMLSGTDIAEMHFGQDYILGMTGSSTQVPYGYAVDYLYRYRCPLGFSCTLIYTNVSQDPATASNSAKTSATNAFSTNSYWSVDPANLLNNTNVVAGGTCGSNMPLTTTQVGSSSEYSQWSLIGYGRWTSGFDLYYEYVYRAKTKGTLTLSLGTSNAQKCILSFDGPGTNPTVSAGTIAVDAESGDGRFEVHNTYNAVDGIDKQDVEITFSPSTDPTTGYVNVGLPFQITLSSLDITEGTAPEFVTGSNFGTYFAPSSSPLDTSIPVNCPDTVFTVDSVLTPTIQQTFTSTTVVSNCAPALKYVGNKYYYGTDNNSAYDPNGFVPLPSMSFAKSSPSVSITSPTASATFGSTVTFTAQVTGAAGAPTGTVTFKEGSNTICSASLSGATPTASCTDDSLSAGSHTITAAYSGDSAYSADSSTTTTVMITKATPTNTLSANPSTPIKSGDSITFTATLTGVSGTLPTGTVTFKDGATSICAGAVNVNASGVATCTTTALTTVTDHTITAQYSGDGNYTGLTSSPVTVKVTSN